MFVSERTDSALPSRAAPREIDVRAIWQAVIQRKAIVATTAVVFTAFAVYLAMTATWIYRGETTIAQGHDTGTDGMTGLAGQFGGIASLAGINLSGAAQDQERMGVLRSRHLVEEFIKRNGALPLLSRGAKTPPTLWVAVENFRKTCLLINEDRVKGLTKVSIDWTDPATAASWANSFVALANEILRTRAMDEANRNIDYLNQQVAHTNVVELQTLMYNLIEQETKSLMLAKGRVEYAFTIVDPAVTSEKRISPRRTLMVLTGLVIGLFLGGLIAVIYDSVQRRRRDAAGQPNQ